MINQRFEQIKNVEKFRPLLSELNILHPVLADCHRYHRSHASSVVNSHEGWIPLTVYPLVLIWIPLVEFSCFFAVSMCPSETKHHTGSPVSVWTEHLGGLSCGLELPCFQAFWWFGGQPEWLHRTLFVLDRHHQKTHPAWRITKLVCETHSM